MGSGPILMKGDRVLVVRDVWFSLEGHPGTVSSLDLDGTVIVEVDGHGPHTFRPQDIELLSNLFEEAP